jgi:Asp-tRNA(Asn)/Glu-tRNA(Gln) amidotransferase A subunit family amidase
MRSHCAHYFPQPSTAGPSRAITYLIPANVTGQPAITVPCGFSHDGLPIGFQLMGRPFEEARLFRLARAYERQHSWVQRKSLWP